jgi:hypothetical protein
VFDFSSIVGFDWDKGNRQKNWEKHRVDYRECEEVFFNSPLIVGDDRTHSAVARTTVVPDPFPVDMVIPFSSPYASSTPVSNICPVSWLPADGND